MNLSKNNSTPSIPPISSFPLHPPEIPTPAEILGIADSIPKPKKVLVVDDTEANRVLLRALLIPAGYEVYEAISGASALISAKHNKPDLIITDLIMPDLTGYALIYAIRKDWELKDTPIILSTAKFPQNETIYLAQSAGASYVLFIPFDHAVLVPVVHGLITKQIKQLNCNLPLALDKVALTIDKLRQWVDDL